MKCQIDEFSDLNVICYKKTSQQLFFLVFFIPYILVYISEIVKVKLVERNCQDVISITYFIQLTLSNM